MRAILSTNPHDVDDRHGRRLTFLSACGWHHPPVLTTTAITVAGFLLMLFVCWDAILATVSPSLGPGPLMRGWLWVATRMPGGPCAGCCRRAAACCRAR